MNIIEKTLLLFFGFILVLVVSLLSIIDQEHGMSYLERIKEFETGLVTYEKKGLSRCIKGKTLLIIAAIQLSIANIVVIVCNFPK